MKAWMAPGKKMEAGKMMQMLKRFQKKYLAFFIVVPILTTTSLVYAECPICHGTGYMSASEGMEHVTVTSVHAIERQGIRDICEMFTLLLYEVDIAVNNEQIEDVENGWVRVILRDYSEARVLDVKYLPVFIPGQSHANISFRVWFRTGLDLPPTTEVRVEPVLYDIPDATCEGTGKLPLNLWLFANGLKTSFEELSREDREFRPPAPYFPPEGGDAGE